MGKHHKETDFSSYEVHFLLVEIAQSYNDFSQDPISPTPDLLASPSSHQDLLEFLKQTR